MKIKVKVIPQAGRQKIVLDATGTIKCYLTSPPENGKANRELIRLFSDALGIPQRNIAIIQGLTARTKVLTIDGIACEAAIHEALGLQIQAKLF